MLQYRFNNEQVHTVDNAEQLLDALDIAVKHKYHTREYQKCLGYLYLSTAARKAFFDAFENSTVFKIVLEESDRVAPDKFYFPTGQFVTLNSL